MKKLNLYTVHFDGKKLAVVGSVKRAKRYIIKHALTFGTDMENDYSVSREGVIDVGAEL